MGLTSAHPESPQTRQNVPTWTGSCPSLCRGGSDMGVLVPWLRTLHGHWSEESGLLPGMFRELPPCTWGGPT